MTKDKIREILEEYARQSGAEGYLEGTHQDQAHSQLQSLLLSDGQKLYMDLCGRLIKRILEFNPDEHDIELNLCGIIEKAKRLGNNTCMCMDCGKVFKVSEQSKHFKECKKDHSLKPQTFTEDDFLSEETK